MDWNLGTLGQNKSSHLTSFSRCLSQRPKAAITRDGKRCPAAIPSGSQWQYSQQFQRLATKQPSRRRQYSAHIRELATAAQTMILAQMAGGLRSAWVTEQDLVTKEHTRSLVRWHLALIPTLWKQTQVLCLEICEFKACFVYNQDYIVGLCLKIKQINKPFRYVIFFFFSKLAIF